LSAAGREIFKRLEFNDKKDSFLGIADGRRAVTLQVGFVALVRNRKLRSAVRRGIFIVQKL